MASETTPRECYPMNACESFGLICALAYVWWTDGYRSHIWFGEGLWHQDLYDYKEPEHDD